MNSNVIFVTVTNWPSFVCHVTVKTWSPLAVNLFQEEKNKNLNSMSAAVDFVSKIELALWNRIRNAGEILFVANIIFLNDVHRISCCGNDLSRLFPTKSLNLAFKYYNVQFDYKYCRHVICSMWPPMIFVVL